jgi:maleate isomerase
MVARVGLIIPSSNRMVEQEMVRAFPAGVQAHVTRLRMTGANHLAFADLLPRIEDAARALVDARCDAVAFHCTANSMEGGRAGEEQILTALARAALASEASGQRGNSMVRAPDTRPEAGSSARAGTERATTTITAIQRAFDALAARRIVLLTPYSAATTEHEAAFLRASGYDILSATGFALAGSDAYCSTPPQFWRDRTVEAARPEADAYLISCANISVFGVIEELEARLARPVVTSNQAVIWDTLRLIGWRDCRGCPGQLFERASDTASRMASHAT